MTGPHIPEPLGKWGPSSKCANDPEADTEFFFPRSYGTSRNPSEHVQEVKAYCSDCATRNTCLETAIATYDDHGMWGGMTPDERRALRKAARQGRKPQSPVYRKLADCGTDAAYRRHKRRGEPVDDACLAAHNKQNAKYPDKDKNRNRKKASA